MKAPWLKPSEALNRPITRTVDDATYSAAALAQAEIMRRLGFHVGNIGLLIATRITSELTDLIPICPIPNTAAWLLGLINLRGNLVPVFDVNLLLQLDKGPDKKRMLLILGQGNTAGAILIDGLPVHVILTVEDKLKSLPPLPETLRPYATSGYEKNGEMWFNFDHLGFFHSLATKVAI
jgi:chemotaxis signal transduction protein